MLVKKIHNYENASTGSVSGTFACFSINDIGGYYLRLVQHCDGQGRKWTPKLKRRLNTMVIHLFFVMFKVKGSRGTFLANPVLQWRNFGQWWP